jgi:hypothetical protein
MLDDKEWRKFSDAEIAARCHVSRPLVAEVRKGLETDQPYPAELQDRRMARRRGKVYPMDLTKIRRKKVGKAKQGGRVMPVGGKSPVSTSQSTETEDAAPPKPDVASARPLTGGDSIECLHQIYARFSALPTAATVAGLIKEQQAAFTGKQASEIVIWFSVLAQLLTGGASENLLRPRSSLRSSHSVMGAQE